MNLKKIRCLGIPVSWGSGLTEYKGKSYRFMVMERLGEDLQRIFKDCGSRFKKETVLQLGARMLDTLEYVHENEYVHGDIKAANLLLGYTNPHEVCLPKPVPKPVQQKQKKTEGEEYMRPNKACTAVTGRRLPDEEKPSNLHRMLPQPEPQQVHLPKPSRKPVQKKQNKMKEEASNYPSRPQARITRRQFPAEEKPVKLNSTIQEPDPEKKDTGRELPPLYSQATFSESRKNNQDQLFTTDHPVSLQEPGLSISTVFRLAFTEERYHYSIAILALLFLIWLSLSLT